MRKIFLSYTTLIYNLINGITTPKDLDNALFSFGCNRLHVYRDIKKDPGEYEFVAPKDRSKINKVNSIITDAVTKAAIDGRVLWCRDISSAWNRSRVEFLANHGIVVDTSSELYLKLDSLNIPGWKELLKDKLECIG